MTITSRRLAHRCRERFAADPAMVLPTTTPEPTDIEHQGLEPPEAVATGPMESVDATG